MNFNNTITVQNPLIKNLFNQQKEISNSLNQIGKKVQLGRKTKRTKFLTKYLGNFFVANECDVFLEMNIGLYETGKKVFREGIIDIRIINKKFNCIIDIEIDSSLKKNSIFKLVKCKKVFGHDVLWVNFRENFDEIIKQQKKIQLFNTIMDNKIPVLVI